jgi:alanyl-tRNA synthetase
VGFHLSDDVVTVDFNGSLSDVQVAEVEMCANKVIYENLEIQVSYPTAEEEQKLSYRSKKELEGQIRIVTIPGVDVCACCAPHVRNTGEIGILKVMNRQNYKGGVRISILCGKRALEAFRKKDELLTSLVKQLSTREEDLPDRMQQLQQERQALQFDLGKTRQKLAWLKLQEQVQKRTAKTQEGASAAETTYLLFEDAMDAKDMRLVINRFLKEYRGVCGIFAGNDAAGYHYILGANHRDCNEVATVMKEKLHAKGGGNAQMIQGSVNARQQDIISALQS